MTDICHEKGCLSVLDASLLQDNIYFMKTREARCKYMEVADIYKLLADHFDLIYFSARKLSFSKGGIITTNNEALYKKLMGFIPLYEGFLTYGGIDVRTMESMAVGLYESLDMEYIAQGRVG